MNIFDTSGDPVFFEVRNEFYRDCDGVLLVFDLKSRLSFDSLDKWLFEMKSELRSINNPLTARFCVCGNKVSLEEDFYCELDYFSYASSSVVMRKFFSQQSHLNNQNALEVLN